ncbi:MAG: S-layer homology domain-containing protein [Bacillota bacterium]
MFKKIILLVLVLVLFTSFSFASLAPWASKGYFSLKYEGVLDDYKLNSNKFNENITREEFTEILVKIYLDLNNKSLNNFDNLYYFNDTQNKYIELGYKLGLINGTGNNKFSPLDNITREQMAVIIRNFVKILNVNTNQVENTNKYADNLKFSSWAAESIGFCRKYNLLNGVGNNKFLPKGTVTFQQGLTATNNLLRSYDLKKKIESGLPQKDILGFKKYKYDKTNLDIYLNRENNLVIYSKGYGELGEKRNLKNDHYQIFEVLNSNNKLPFKTIDKSVEVINELYDYTNLSYINDTLYIDINTGKIVNEKQSGVIKIESQNILELTIIF